LGYVTFKYPNRVVIIGGGKIRMTVQGNLLSKTLVIGIIFLFIGMSIIPSIGNISKASSILGFTSIEIHQPVPKIICSGVFEDSYVEPGQNVTGMIKICNCGDELSLLNWHVDTTNVPTWGTWKFIPDNGTDVLKPNCAVVDVGVQLTSEWGEYCGKITIYNSDNLTDYCEVHVWFKPRVKATTYSLFQFLFERFPFLEVFLRAMNLLK
jgi:hypothetical protein